MSREPITSTDYQGEAMTLVDENTFAPILVGEVRTSREERYAIVGGRAPHKPGSSGRVGVCAPGGTEADFEFYPSVVGAKWMHDSTLAAVAAVAPKARRTRG